MRKEVKFERKSLIYGGVIIILIFFAIYWIYQNSIFGKNIDCIKKEMEFSEDNYLRGALFVRFPDNFTDEEIKKIVKSYGLDVSYITIGRFALVSVPQNTETAWACEFEKNKYVLDVDYVRKGERV